MHQNSGSNDTFHNNSIGYSALPSESLDPADNPLNSSKILCGSWGGYFGGGGSYGGWWSYGSWWSSGGWWNRGGWWNNGGGGNNHGGGNDEPNPVPIPPSIILMGTGLIGLVGLSRRKTNS
jgi:hypothetical protein